MFKFALFVSLVAVACSLPVDRSTTVKPLDHSTTVSGKPDHRSTSMKPKDHSDKPKVEEKPAKASKEAKSAAAKSPAKSAVAKGVAKDSAIKTAGLKPEPIKHTTSERPFEFSSESPIKHASSERPLEFSSELPVKHASSEGPLEFSSELPIKHVSSDRPLEFSSESPLVSVEHPSSERPEIEEISAEPSSPKIDLDFGRTTVPVTEWSTEMLVSGDHELSSLEPMSDISLAFTEEIRHSSDLPLEITKEPMVDDKKEMKDMKEKDEEKKE